MKNREVPEMKWSIKKAVAAIIAFAVLAAVIVLAAYLKQVADYKRAVSEIFIEEVHLSDIPDGVFLPQQRHTPGQLIDLFLRTADRNVEILQGTFRNAAHLLNKFAIGLAALGQIGEVYHCQILKIRLVELLPYLPDNFRRTPQDRHRKFDDARMFIAALVRNVSPYHLRYFLSQSDPHDCRRVCDHPRR